MIKIRIETNLGKLDYLDKSIQNAISTGLQKAGFAIERDAKLFAPVKTGRLRASINTQKLTDLKISVQDGVLYGVYNELGTRYMNPHPFLLPAFEKNKLMIPRLVQEEINKILR